MIVKKGIRILLGLVVVSCIGRSVPEQRFVESRERHFSSQIALPDPERFTFAAVGDLHISGENTTQFRRILQMAQDEGDAFIVLLGDLVDTGEEADVVAFRQAIDEMGWTGRVFPVIGNHDIFYGGWLPYLAHNGPSHYSVTVGNTKLVAIDTADGGLSEAEKEWFKRTLEEPRPTHVFVLSHYPPHVSGIPTYLRLSDEKESLRLMKWASANRVTGWLAAHYHSYVLGEVDGVDYLVAGGGGGRRMAPIWENFFAQVSIDGEKVNYELRVLPQRQGPSPR